ncbi:L-aspartate oxidase [Clostridium sp.]|uniref:L-aspartate oxidase n=1 Tax=Clostridium sp. TaxID=1506 RepID=UPI002FC77E90
MDINTDVLIVGTGAAGLYSALNLREDLNIIMITKGNLTQCNSYLAQGGISVAVGKEDVPAFIEDTMRAGNYKNNKNSVKILCEESMECVHDLVEFGTPFNKVNEELCYTREGAHSTFRIAYCNDNTGKHVVDTLINKAKKKKNITVIENSQVVDLITKDNTCSGAVIIQGRKQLNVFCKVLILATGGIGGLFKNSTNERSITGDGLFIALKYNIHLKDISYIQFHPTAFYKRNSSSRRFLISESVRGEGGKLLNLKGESFINELLPRDVVSQAINKEIASSGIPFVHLDISHRSSDFIRNRFPSIYKECMMQGIDITKYPIPVSPAQHYFMGGINVNEFSQTSMKNLYAVGETSCTGAHGSNRLASNSLLEGFVFSKRAAKIINSTIDSLGITFNKVPLLVSSLENIQDYQRKTVIEELKRRSHLLNDELFSYRQDNIKCSAGGYALF